MGPVSAATSDRVHFSIEADEIVDPATTVTIRLPGAVDAQSVQSAIRVIRGSDEVPATITRARNGRSVKVDLGATTHFGAYRLEIDELLSTKGERITEMVRLPFCVLPASCKALTGKRVEHSVRLEFDDLNVHRLAPGQTGRNGHVDVMKVVDRTTGEPAELAFDEQGSVVDIRERLTALDKRRAQKFGSLDPGLYERLGSTSHGERIPVVVWARIELPSAPYEKPADQRSAEPPRGEARVAESVRPALANLQQALARHDVSVRGKSRRDDTLPLVTAEVTADQLRALSRDEAVGAIFFDDRTATNDLGNSIAIARTNTAHALGFDGTGVRVAVFEDGPSDTTNLSFEGRYTSSPDASAHARLTSAIIKNTEPRMPHGHAPDCDLYSANSSDNDALLWAVRDQGCTVISQSFHRSSEPGSATLQSDDVLKDWLALRWPYPTIVQAAGNFWKGDDDAIDPPEAEYVNHKGYNTLSVGNHNDSASAMSGDSTFRNPSTAHGDRELPEIAANGTWVAAVGENMPGTSFAAPAAAGVVALLQDVDPVLSSWPEGCRAIMLAAAGRNVRGGTWWQDVSAGVDGRDGAGAVDAGAGVAIARQRRRRNASASRHGWDVGTLSSSAIGRDGLATFRYHIHVPPLLVAARVKVALAWDSAVSTFLGFPLFSRLTVDLDLSVRDSHGAIVGTSASWDNSYEIVEFAARAGETYEVVIRRWSGSDDVWFGVAWTVSGRNLLLPVESLQS
ncbi:S8 family serine peptidase [Mycobacterium sp. 3519A]|uniref:S8 family serine peptidase n=1 Tax=Mycobacterium sp. 3519A TaxID=2057184 RepID=UPI000C7D9702|nr:S8 family serine peptidase [Mycobacterium sp. 3519A]